MEWNILVYFNTSVYQSTVMMSYDEKQ